MIKPIMSITMAKHHYVRIRNNQVSAVLYNLIARRLRRVCLQKIVERPGHGLHVCCSHTSASSGYCSYWNQHHATSLLYMMHSPICTARTSPSVSDFSTATAAAAAAAAAAVGGTERCCKRIRACVCVGGLLVGRFSRAEINIG
jgi:hypothetical protein